MKISSFGVLKCGKYTDETQYFEVFKSAFETCSCAKNPTVNNNTKIRDTVPTRKEYYM